MNLGRSEDSRESKNPRTSRQNTRGTRNKNPQNTTPQQHNPALLSNFNFHHNLLDNGIRFGQRTF